MPLVPIADLDDYVKETLTKIREGAKEFGRTTGHAVRLGPVQFSCEVVFDGAEVVQSRQETSQEEGSKKTVTTEKPIGTDSTSHGEITTTVKSGNYVQGGTQSTSQGGGSSEVENWEYDET